MKLGALAILAGGTGAAMGAAASTWSHTGQGGISTLGVLMIYTIAQAVAILLAWLANRPKGVKLDA